MDTKGSRHPDGGEAQELHEETAQPAELNEAVFLNRHQSEVVPARQSVVIPKSIADVHRSIAETAMGGIQELSSDGPDSSPANSDLSDLKVLRHELANPATTALNAVTILRREFSRRNFPETDQIYPILTMVEESIEQMIGLLKSATKSQSDLPPMDPQENPDFARIDFSGFLRKMMVMWQTFAENEGIAFHGEVADDVSIRGENVKTYEILSNLMSNAIEILKLEKKHRPHSFDASQPAISLTMRVHPKIDGLVQVFIRDNGPGILQEHRVKIFSKGFSRKAGEGIGLWRSRKLAREMGGLLFLVNNEECDDFIEGETGKGATAIFELPLYPEEEASSEDGMEG